MPEDLAGNIDAQTLQGKSLSEFVQVSANPTTQTINPSTPTGTPVAARVELLYASDGSKLYSFGGISPGTSTRLATAEVYDPILDTSTALTNMPANKSESGCAYWDGKIYMPGGYENGARTSTHRIYDIATNSYTTGAAWPISAFEHQVHIVDGILYTFGGYTTTHIVNAYKYDIDLNTWTAVANIPGSVYAQGGCVNGTDIHLFGGYSSNTWTLHWRYDTTNNTYTTEASMATARYDSVVVNVEGLLYVMSGYSSIASNVLLSTEVYDTRSKTWITGYTHNLPSSRYGGIGAYINGKLYVANGAQGSTGASTNQTTDVLDPSIEIATKDGIIISEDEYGLRNLTTGASGKVIAVKQGQKFKPEHPGTWNGSTNIFKYRYL